MRFLTLSKTIAVIEEKCQKKVKEVSIIIKKSEYKMSFLVLLSYLAF